MAIALERRARPVVRAPAVTRPTRSVFRVARAWSTGASVALAALAAFLVAWNLSANGDANQYYSAAVLSMTQSWKAFFFGAIDSAAFITVDKPPFALWVQALSARLFGFSSWSILLPEAAATLATVVAVYRSARRQFGTLAGTVAGLVLALTPITVAVARDNIPDAILIALMVGGAWTTLRATRTGRLLPLLLTGLLVGLAFNTKMLQAYLVVPAFALAYLVAAPGSLLRRIRNLAAAGAVLAAMSASWMVVVDAIPASMRPFIGGSTDGTVLNLVLGYNGLGRIFGRAASEVTGGAVAAGGGANFGGAAGLTRLFNAQLAGQISWLLPLAAGSLVAGLVSRGRRARTDLRRAWFVLWGGWLAVHALVFSFAQGTFHPYYSSAMAPAVAALVGPGLVALWRLYRRSWATAWLLPLSIGGTATWAAVLIARADWLPWLAPAVGAAGGLAVAGLLVGRVLRTGTRRWIARGRCARARCGARRAGGVDLDGRDRHRQRHKPDGWPGVRAGLRWPRRWPARIRRSAAPAYEQLRDHGRDRRILAGAVRRDQRDHHHRGRRPGSA